MEQVQSASREFVATGFSRYNAATLGFKEYWYPLMFSRQLGRRPVARKLAGIPMMLLREHGKAFALHDRCPHRGIPLTVDPRREFPGTISCGYHGWTYDLESGRLVAAITDGPDSPICGKVTVRTYPVEERAGIVWVYPGDATPPPVEDDIPDELLRPDAVIDGIMELREGNWRYAVENGIDEGHAKYLHRNTPWMFIRKLPAWSSAVSMELDESGWLLRKPGKVEFEAEFPGLGVWPRERFLGIPPFWKKPGRNASQVAVRLPGFLRVRQQGWTDYEMWVPVDENHNLTVLLAVRFTRGLDSLFFRLRYRTYIRWLYHGLLNRGQDGLMIRTMQIPPERLYRPDVSITAWRRLCQEHARRSPGEKDPAERPRAKAALGRSAERR